jgi:aldose sugar dehydrogenase
MPRDHGHVVRRSGAALVAVSLVLATAAASCAPAPRLHVGPVVNGLANPWDIAFAGNGDMYFTERVGRINRLTKGHRIVLGTPADVAPIGEGGMMGIALDPGFPTNRTLYTCLRSTAGGAPDIRIARWQLTPGLTGLASRTDILTGIPTNPSGRHSGCRIRIGPDHMLWVGTGDAATGTTPQDPSSLGGKVLRITGTGSPAPGNAGPPFRPEVYNYGHRNVQGIAFSPSGKAYDIEHGPDRDDEINLLVRGGNYGWDPVPGYNESVPMTDLRKFPNARRAVWSSGSPTIAPSGGTFLNGGQWHSWNGTLAVAVLKGSQLRVFKFNGNGTIAQQWTAVTNRGRLRVATEGPNRNLYVATDANPGQILSVAPVG